MKKRLSANKIIYGRIRAVFCLAVALALTLTGVLRWSIFLYAAAPFYFVALVIFFSCRSQPPVHDEIVEHVDMNGWF